MTEEPNPDALVAEARRLEVRLTNLTDYWGALASAYTIAIEKGGPDVARLKILQEQLVKCRSELLEILASSAIPLGPDELSLLLPEPDTQPSSSGTHARRAREK